MTRCCEVTGKSVMTGNNVSHAHNKTRRRFLPNLQVTSLFSEALGKMVRLRISSQALRTIEHKGGFDVFLVAAKDVQLSDNMRRVKKRIKKALAKTAA
ncbi:MAG: 50S ribosomal protein L28 [Alphaproteobacteria bacterium]|nr:50S ribosomal protein L28 [Rhodospirillaceae bacterium]MDP6031175.1 50S ribosomal protein L28 [Alphaproteobacteria bacterium]MDP7190803.1 50S ribosomal protein L28 [Alphaproteobacteria bacterium]HJO89106.1 50S ribosomal protein L28 [Alphaproteobacteria bacterium]